MDKTAILILTHFLDPSLVGMFRRIRAETSDSYDVFIALNLDDKPLRMPKAAQDVQDALFLCNTAKLLALGYPEKCRPEGWSGKGWKAIDNIDTIILSFFRDHPGYAFVWGVEYDMYYQGKWGFLFERFEASRADLLACMLDSAARTPDKVLMPPFRDAEGKQPDYKDAVVGTFAIHRLSRRMLRTIDQCYRDGWNGHYEFTWGTMAKRHGLEIEDIGGAGPYVRAHNRNVFYFNTISRWDMAPGTLVFRPAFKEMLKHENTLWHPIKPAAAFNHCPALPEKNLYGWAKTIAKSFLYAAVIRAWFLFRWRPASAAPLPPEPGVRSRAATARSLPRRHAGMT